MHLHPYQVLFRTILSFLLLAGPHLTSAEINFRTEPYQELFKEGLRDRKLIFIDFRADWCKPCIQMERTTFKDSALSEFVNRQFISIKADIDFFDGMDLKEMFSVHQFPTMLLVEAEYKDIITRIIGFKDARQLESELRSIRYPEFYELFPEPEPAVDSNFAIESSDTMVAPLQIDTSEVHIHGPNEDDSTPSSEEPKDIRRSRIIKIR